MPCLACGVPFVTIAHGPAGAGGFCEPPQPVQTSRAASSSTSTRVEVTVRTATYSLYPVGGQQ